MSLPNAQKFRISSTTKSLDSFLLKKKKSLRDLDIDISMREEKVWWWCFFEKEDLLSLFDAL